MLRAFLTYINEQKLFEPSEKILLAVSGGKDSVAMFHLFSQANFHFAVAHCNFQLRGRDSEEDQIFVEQLCEENKVSFHKKTFDTKTFAKNNQVSIEMAARSLRYQWFEELRQELNFDYVATAHHLNDSIETVFLNLTKGTGFSGLKGILVKNKNIIRPMLFASREKIDIYAAKKEMLWREDSSNASNDYQRNLIRNEVVPLLKKINPNLDETFARNLGRFQSLEAVFRKNLAHFKAKVMRQENGIFYLKIRTIKYWQSADYFLEELLKEFGFNYFQAREIFQSLDGVSGKVFFSKNYTLSRDRENLIISLPFLSKELPEIIVSLEQIYENYPFYFSGKILKFTLLDSEQIDLKSHNNEAIIFVDFDKIRFPILLRPWRAGDWFIPLGMKGKKKISDFLIDKKIPVPLKKNIFLLTSEEAIVWVVNYRVDDRFKLSDTTKKVLKIEIF